MALRASDLIAIERHARIIDTLLTARAGEFAGLARRSAHAKGTLGAHGTRRRRIGHAIAVVIEAVANIEAWFDGTNALEGSIVTNPRAGLARRLIIGRYRRITRHTDLRIIRRATSRNTRMHTHATRTRTCIGRTRIAVITLPVDIATSWLQCIRARRGHRIANIDRTKIRVRAIRIRLTTTGNRPARTRPAWTRTNGRRTVIALRAVQIGIATTIDERMRTHATSARTNIDGAQIIVGAIRIGIATTRHPRMRTQKARPWAQIHRARIAIVAFGIRRTAIRNLRMRTHPARRWTKVQRTRNAVIAIAVFDTTRITERVTRPRHRYVRHHRRQKPGPFELGPHLHISPFHIRQHRSTHRGHVRRRT